MKDILPNRYADPSPHVAPEAGRGSSESLPTAAWSLEERLQRFDPARHGGEAMVSQPVGMDITG